MTAVIFFLSFSLYYAQGEAAVPFLKLQQSPLFIGAGETGASMPTDDPAGFYFNPANLGNFSRTSNFGLYIMPYPSDWMSLGLKNKTMGMSIGYNFADSKINLPISIGLGYIHNRFDFGTFYQGNDSFESYDKFDNFSFGIGVDYYLRFNLGISYKSFYSQLGNINIGDSKILASTSGSAYDFGAMLTIPISHLLIEKYQYSLNDNASLIPSFNITFGYSLSNYGDEINYGEPAQSDPIPRSARVGYTVDFGVKMKLNKNIVSVAKLSLITEVSDVLIKRGIGDNDNLYINYQGFLGDISLFENLILQKGGEDVTIHRGSVFDFLETATLMYGKIDGRGYYNKRTHGLIIRTDGIFKLLLSSIENPNIKFMAEHLSFQYYNVENIVKSKIEGISLRIKKINLANFGF